MSTHPPRFYRYLSLNAKTVESLCHDALHFANPADFNDPFDCKPVVEPDSDLATLRAVLRTLIASRVSAETLNALKTARLKGDRAVAHAHHSSEQEAARTLADIAYQATDPYYTCSAEKVEQGLLTAAVERELLRQYDKGVCCFSESFNNPLLWGHYGDKHKGVCIGYGLDRKPRPEMHKVVYGGTRTVRASLIAQAILEKNEKAIAALDRDIFLRKAPQWRYEKEWRLLGSRGVQDSCLLLTDVTFGLRCTPALKHTLISALEPRAPDVKFYEIYNAPGTFRLKRGEVDTDELRRYFPMTAWSATEAFGEPTPD